MSRTTALRLLAERLGVLPEYVDLRGMRRPTSDDTRVALLHAMGVDGSGERAAAQALERLVREERERVIEPVRFTKPKGRDARRLRVRVPDHVGARTVEFELILREEHGEEHVVRGRLRAGGKASVDLHLPTEPRLGYHDLQLTLALAGRDVVCTQLRIASPSACLSVRDVMGAAHGFGIWTNLYSVRSDEQWGIGDLTDLDALCGWAGEQGAAFVAINPLHALHNEGSDVSPYGPVSRVYLNEVYLDVTRVPEFVESRGARSLASEAGFQARLAGVRAATDVEYDRVKLLKRDMLRLLYETFVERHLTPPDGRGRAYAAFLEREGQTLQDFATFVALDAWLRSEGIEARDWRSWPPEYRDPQSAAVAAFRRAHRRDIEFHCYVQFVIDEQYGDLAARTASTMPVGIFGDLAIGSAPGGSDTWSCPHLFATGVHVGAPPDDFAPEGQDWGLPPVVPHALRADRYRYWIAVVRSALRHAGAVRIDHAMGLYRQFWIPEGVSGKGGGYVRYPGSELMSILALESHRHRALIVGEDLGTVPPGFRSLLARWNVLSYRVLYFERERSGRFRAAARYSGRAVTVAHTHDQVPLAGHRSGHDLVLRRESGAIGSDRELAELQTARRAESEALWRRLRAEALVPDRGAEEPGVLCAGVYEFLARTPAPLIGVSLDDLGGEESPVNLPGVPADRFRSWSRRMRLTLDTLRASPSAREILARVMARRMGRQAPTER